MWKHIWPIDRALSGGTTPGQSGPRSDGNKVVLRISQNSSIIGTSLWGCLVSYPGHLSAVGSYSSEEMQSVYSTRQGLVWFYGISTILAYVMPNPFLYIFQITQLSRSTADYCGDSSRSLVVINKIIIFSNVILCIFVEGLFFFHLQGAEAKLGIS